MYPYKFISLYISLEFLENQIGYKEAEISIYFTVFLNLISLSILLSKILSILMILHRQ